MPNPSETERVSLKSRNLLGSRIARLIFASNLAGLIILIIGAMVLNEMRASFVVSKKQDLVVQATIFSNLIAENATFGEPQARLDTDMARTSLEGLYLPESLRAKLYSIQGELIADSYFLSNRVLVESLPPLRAPSQTAQWSRGLSEWAVSVLESVRSDPAQASIRTGSFDEEFNAALNGEEAASQRFNERGQRIISVSLPVQHVSSIVGVLTLESNGIAAIIRAERAALIPFIAVAILVALITSALLTIAIANPLNRLASAADHIGRGSSEPLSLPQISGRHDEIGRLAGSLEAMTSALFERITANEAFAADVAHELKNPLTSIRSAVETAERVRDDPVAVEKLRLMIAKDVQRLDRLITDISNASRLEAEVTRIPVAQLDIGRFLRDLVATYETLTEKTGIQVRFEDETMNAGLTIYGREGPLGQVMRNLIDNACSFSPAQGQVLVRLRQGRAGPQTTVRIYVEDSGPGIPQDKLTKIFDRFYTDRPAGAAFGNNSGLGLSIVAQIVSTHMGTVHAQNRPEGGARFCVELPAQ